MIIEIHFGSAIVTKEMPDNINREKFEKTLLNNLKIEPEKRHRVKFHYLTEKHTTLPKTMIRRATVLDSARQEKLDKNVNDGQSHLKRIQQRVEEPRTKKLTGKEIITNVDDMWRKMGLGECFNVPQEKTINGKEYPEYRFLTEEELEEQRKANILWKLEQAKKEKLEVLLDKTISNTVNKNKLA